MASTTVESILRLSPVLPVVTFESADDAPAVAAALLRGGIRAIEVTLRTPVALPAIEAIARRVPEAVVGAGTVRSPDDLRAAAAAGARFAVSPGATPALLEAAAAGDLPYLPAVATASELMAGLAAGFGCFKFFPAAAAGGQRALRAFAAPFPEAMFCATGGIDAGTAQDWLDLPNVLCVGGSWLTPPALLAARDWAAIEALAAAAASTLGRAPG